MKSPFFATWLPVCLITAILVSTTTLATAQGEPYKQAARAITDAKQVSNAKRDVRRVFTSNGPLTQDDQKALKRWYALCVFAAMTLPSAADRPDQFPKWRTEITKQLEAVREKPQLHDYIRDEIVFKTLKSLSTGNYNPACRYNAVLILGNLNQTEARVNGNPYAIPFAPAREFLLKLINPRNKQPQAVQVAAMIGLRRQAQLLRANGMRDADKEIVPPMLAMIKAPMPANELEHDAHYWKMRLAIETLGAVGLSGAAPSIQQVVANPSLPLWVRCAAAESLGELDYRNAKNLDGEAIVKGLGNVALTACVEEIQRIKRYEEEHPMDPDANRPRFGLEAQQVEANPAVVQARRVLKHNLGCVKFGLKGVGAAASDQTTLVASINSKIDAIERQLDDNPDTTTPQELLEKIGPPAMQLEQAIQ
ncbi:MAG: hypothetical protein GY768_23035 [Planctomycetaceae bacterium]|nr:hypothetical protein [Planctomycetaceae bacterium]